MGNMRVRFAPSPTGYLHIGGARTALFNWLLAKNTGGKFILRIEDTDQQRSTQASEDVILRAMKWLGLDWDEGPETGGEYGPYRQSERLDTYKEYVNKLLENKKAFKCYCTQEELEKAKEESIKNGEEPIYSGKCRNLSEEQIKKYEQEGRKPVIRFRVPQNQTIELNDLSRGKIEFDSNLIGDFVLQKSDGFPSYNFAVVIDDFLMKITHVVRGDDHITNTPKQIMLYKALEANVPEFAHIPMILGNDGSRLSKRHGATSVEEYQKEGYLKEAVVNYLSLLGWSPKNNDEIMELDNIIERFNLKDVSKSPAVFDNNKLKWMNSQYIKKVDIEYLADVIKPFIDNEKYEIKDKDWLVKALEIAREPITLLTEINEQLVYFFDSTIDKTVSEDIKEIFSNESAFIVIDKYVEKLKEIKEEDYNYESLRDALKFVQKEYKIKGKELFMPMRVALTYKTSGPGIYPMLLILGKEKSIKRIEEFREAIKR